jgi:hypothetical protein
MTLDWPGIWLNTELYRKWRWCSPCSRRRYAVAFVEEVLPFRCQNTVAALSDRTARVCRQDGKRCVAMSRCTMVAASSRSEFVILPWGFSWVMSKFLISSGKIALHSTGPPWDGYHTPPIPAPEASQAPRWQLVLGNHSNSTLSCGARENGHTVRVGRRGAARKRVTEIFSVFEKPLRHSKLAGLECGVWGLAVCAPTFCT